LSTAKKHNINSSLDTILYENMGCCISEISIIHRTGRPRIIFTNGHIYDVGFEKLIEYIKDRKENFCNELLIKYCKFSKKQVDKLIANIPYRISSKKFKDDNFGFSEILLTYAKDKHLKTVTLVQ